MSKPVKISGSRAAAICGESKYQTQVHVWLILMEELTPGFCAKNNFELPIFEGNSATRFGNAFESEILALAEKKHNIIIRDRQKFFERDYLSCHVDGLTDDALIECKTTNQHNFGDFFGRPDSDLIPIEYHIQIAHNMLLSGKQKCIMPLLVFPYRQDQFEEIGIGQDNNFDMINIAEWVRVLDQMGCLKYYYINAMQGLQDELIKIYDTFWNENVLKAIPPEIKTYDDIRALVREPVGTIIADETIERLVAERNNIKDEISGSGPLAKRAEQIKVDLLKYMKDAGAVIDDESESKWILRDRQGRKLATYGKDKNGRLIFR